MRWDVTYTHVFCAPRSACRIRVTHVHACSDCVHTRNDTVRLNHASQFVRVIHSSHIVSIKLGSVTPSATKQYFLSLDKCFPIPHMIPRNRRPTVASRVRRNIFFGCSQLAFFSPCANLGPACLSRNFLLSRIDTGRWDFFLEWSPRLTKQHFYIFHFVLQTADPTGHNRFTLLDARGPPQSSTLLRCHLRGTIAAWSPVSRVGNSPSCPSNSPCSLYILWEDDRATGEAGKNFHPRT